MFRAVCLVMRKKHHCTYANTEIVNHLRSFGCHNLGCGWTIRLAPFSPGIHEMDSGIEQTKYSRERFRELFAELEGRKRAG
jgi:hypothetical protein